MSCLYVLPELVLSTARPLCKDSPLLLNGERGLECVLMPAGRRKGGPQPWSRDEDKSGAPAVQVPPHGDVGAGVPCGLFLHLNS